MLIYDFRSLCLICAQTLLVYPRWRHLWINTTWQFDHFHYDGHVETLSHYSITDPHGAHYANCLLTFDIDYVEPLRNLTFRMSLHLVAKILPEFAYFILSFAHIPNGPPRYGSAGTSTACPRRGCRTRI